MTIWNTGRTGVRHEPVKTARTYHWRGEEFISQSDVAAEAGVDVRTIRLHLQKHGNLDHLQPGDPDRASPKARAIEVDGVTYRSARAFALAHGIPEGTVHTWRKLGQMDKFAQAARRGEVSA